MLALNLNARQGAVAFLIAMGLTHSQAAVQTESIEWGAASTEVYSSNTRVTINDLSGGYDSYYVGPPQAMGTPETHIIGVYETRNDHSGGYHPTGTAFVHVTGNASTPVNLVLSSYEPTQWVLDGDGLGNIQSILISGYHDSFVEGVDASIVSNKTYLGTSSYFSACAYRWPDDNQGCATAQLISRVEAHYGTPVTSFSGIYRSTEFTVALAPIPEPSTYAFMALGLLGVAGAVRRRR